MGRHPFCNRVFVAACAALVCVFSAAPSDADETCNSPYMSPLRRELAHVLKVFLIDRAGFIREIYTSTFLHPQTLLNDIDTLVMEDSRQGAKGPR